MARRRKEPVYSRVDFGEIEGLEECSALVWCNFPIRMLDDLSEREPGTMRKFMAKVIKSWDGFDLPCNEEGIGELDLDEVREMFPIIMRHITNPQMRNRQIT